MNSSNSLLTLKDFLPYRLSVLSNRISGAIQAHYSDKFNLNLQEWRVMAILGEATDLSANQVAEKTAMDKVAVSRAVKSLLKKSHIERHFSDQDKRRSVLRLSESGRKIYEDVAPIAIAYEQNLLADMSDEDRQHLERLLDHLDNKIAKEGLV